MSNKELKEEMIEELEVDLDTTEEDLLQDAIKASQEIEDVSKQVKEDVRVEDKKTSSEVKDLEFQLEKLRADFDVKENQFKRLASDFENFRRRQAQEKEDLLKFGMEKLITDLLPVVDNFERALASAKNAPDVSTVISGIEMIQKQLLVIMEKNGVEGIESLDKPFDPKFHEAVQQMVNAEKPDQTVLHELQKGYLLSGRVIRPSMVVVSTLS